MMIIIKFCLLHEKIDTKYIENKKKKVWITMKMIFHEDDEKDNDKMITRLC